jgi:hypothetical protein
MTVIAQSDDHQKSSLAKHMDIKKPSYQIAFPARQQQLEDSIKTEHHGSKPSEDPQIAIKPHGDSEQLHGEGSK